MDLDLETSFGEIIVNGKRYNYDVVIDWEGHVYPRPKELSSKKRTLYGHTPLSLEEVEKILEDFRHIDTIVIGTGQSGMLPVEEAAEREIRSRGILLIKDATSRAIKKFLEMIKTKRRVLGIFHVTC